MTKKLNSFTASLASTSTVPRLLFKRNQPEPEISRIWSPDVLATPTSRQRCLTRQDRRHWASRSRLSSCGRSTRSCRRGLRAVLFRVGVVASFGAWSISGDRGLGPRPYGVSATFPIFFAVLNEMMDRRLRRRNVRAIWQLAESSSEDELAVGAIDCPLKCVNRI